MPRRHLRRQGKGETKDQGLRVDKFALGLRGDIKPHWDDRDVYVEIMEEAMLVGRIIEDESVPIIVSITRKVALRERCHRGAGRNLEIAGHALRNIDAGTHSGDQTDSRIGLLGRDEPHGLMLANAGRNEHFI
jgi:hypothetical protein